MPVTFSTRPGFADVPDSVLAAEQFALGRHLVAISENAKFGFVFPEFFHDVYKNGDTVVLPVSPVDGYQYTRSELMYHWAVQTTQNASQWETGPGSFWFGQWFVNQTTGKVTTEEFYRTSGHDHGKSNDGFLLVTTIAVRRKNSITMASTPTFSDVADSALASDKAYKESTIQGLNRNSKFAVVGSEVLAMGEFGNGDQVPQPTSPIDGYVYDYSEVKKFLFSWVWTPPYAQYATPVDGTGKPRNQLGRLQAAIDASGNVSLTVTYYDDGEIPTNDGRVMVFAFCCRDGVSSIGNATLFADVLNSSIASGNPVKTNIIKQINSNIRESVLRPEYFDAGEFTNGATVALPVSPVDGYTYTRDECIYVWEVCDTGAETSGNIRIVLWYAWVDPSTGAVTFNRYALLNGGTTVNLVHTGKIRVVIVAMRSHIAADPTDVPDTSEPGGILGAPDSYGDTVNGV
jgi:hypothetical protein